MDALSGENEIAKSTVAENNQGRNALLDEAFSRQSVLSGPFNPHDVAEAGAKAITDIVERNGGFGESDPYGVPKDRDITKLLMQDARKGGYLDEMVRDMNMIEIKQNSDLRFDLDKHTYFMTAQEKPILYTVQWDKLTVAHNMSKEVDHVAVRSQLAEKLDK